MNVKKTAIWLIGWLLAGVLAAGHVAGDNGGSTDWVGKIVSLQGRVVAKRLDAGDWQPVQLNDTFVAGDRIQVGANSRAGVVLRNDSVLRLDQNTTLVFVEIERETTFVLELIKGAANFFSRRPRALKILTPFVNGVVEGTEFFVRVDEQRTQFDLFEGRLLAENAQGSLHLESGQGAVAMDGGLPQRTILVRPRDSVQWALYYPFFLDLYADATAPAVDQSLAFLQNGKIAEAITSLEQIEPEERTSRFFVFRAGLLLHVGRVAEAANDLETALALDPDNGNGQALQAVIAVVQNETETALDLARRAVARSPQSGTARIALSYALQSDFKLEDALQAAREAAALSPDNARVHARVAELQLSTGDLEKAEQSARKAVALEPLVAHGHTILGYAYLIRIQLADARDAFLRAISLDSADPLPRLGLGLAKIRTGDLKAGRSDIEIAAGLDPANALIRSYLGKAYFDEKRGPLDEKQFAIAKTLDPNDPTPWFYDAIRKQTQNRPVEALKDLQKSIELNDNRAVYRSRLQLDQDLASRSASLGRIYKDLGFQELALRQGWRSLNVDPSNYSAHRLLADTYSTRSRHEIARVSELLQSQLLQPLSITAVQPQLAESNLFIPEGAGPGSASFFEFNPLFTRNRLAFQASGLAGDNQTWGDEITISGLYNQLSGSAGQYHYETEGFRENNHLDQDIYNAIVQTALTPKLNVQGEYRRRNEEHGDLSFRWDLDNFDPSFQRSAFTDTFRIGANIKPANHSTLIASFIYQDYEEELYQVFTEELFGTVIEFPLETEFDSDGYIGEIQYLYDNTGFDLLVGGGHYDLDATTTLPNQVKESDTQHSNGYVYSYLRFPSQLLWTLAASYDYLEDELAGDVDQFNPKIGINLSLQDRTMLRLAAFRVLKRTLVANQTVEPTHVAGFNQFYDDFNGSDAIFYGAGLDHTFTGNVHAGIEYGQRQLETPVAYETFTEIFESEESTLRAYLYWTFFSNLALSTEYKYETYERDESAREDDATTFIPLEIDTHLVPLKLGYFHRSGVFGRLTGTYAHQEVLFDEVPGETEKDDFTVFDLAVGYRFPKRYGVFSLEIRNLFDTSFNYYGDEQRSSQFVTESTFTPERTFLARVTVAF